MTGPDVMPLDSALQKAAPVPALKVQESDGVSLEMLTAVASHHTDEDVRFLARIVMRLLSERVAESSRVDFQAGMPRGEHSSSLARAFSQAVRDIATRS